MHTAAVMGMALAGGGFGWIGWILGLLQWRTPSSRPRRELAWDIGPHWPSWVMRVAPIASGVIGAAVVWEITHNVGEVMGLSIIAGMLPRLMWITIRRHRRIELDTQFYSLANTLRLLLPITSNVIDALRDVRDTSDNPLADVLTVALRRETRETGAATEFLRAVGHDLGLGEVELFGDILTQVRTQTVQASELLTNLTMLWGDRLQVEQKRAGKIAGSRRLASVMLVATLLVQLGWPLVSQTIAQLDRSVIAAIFGAIASGMTLGAWALLTQQLQKTAA
ncbi:type II secretion system F family protein [Sulfobacillus thermosulfidooxidans]|uniref:type II secretion system F family protein n=1 Tax=Sulfobacillus thermosulfidooxidans TaxID=28034 RepID=UPI0006B563C3|nr:hypothetical protein [Sulfobacillus thermosulfidooxidans]